MIKTSLVVANIMFLAISNTSAYAENDNIGNIEVHLGTTEVKEVRVNDVQTIKPNHQKICEELGGVEVTGGKATMGPGTIDGGVCEIKSNNNTLNNLNTSLYLAAPAGSVAFPSQFNAGGIIQVRDVPPVRLAWELSIPTDQCSFSQETTISGDYQAQPWILCRTAIRGVVQSQMKGCLNGTCYYAYGEIRQGV